MGKRTLHTHNKPCQCTDDISCSWRSSDSFTKIMTSHIVTSEAKIDTSNINTIFNSMLSVPGQSPFTCIVATGCDNESHMVNNLSKAEDHDGHDLQKVVNNCDRIVAMNEDIMSIAVRKHVAAPTYESAADITGTRPVSIDETESVDLGLKHAQKNVIISPVQSEVIGKTSNTDECCRQPPPSAISIMRRSRSFNSPPQSLKDKCSSHSASLRGSRMSSAQILQNWHSLLQRPRSSSWTKYENAQNKGDDEQYNGSTDPCSSKYSVQDIASGGSSYNRNAPASPKNISDKTDLWKQSHYSAPVDIFDRTKIHCNPVYSVERSRSVRNDKIQMNSSDYGWYFDEDDDVNYFSSPRNSHSKQELLHVSIENIELPLIIHCDTNQHSKLSKPCSNKNDKVRKRRYQKSIRFGNLEVRSYSIVLGDNPSCSSGPSISIGWDFDVDKTVVTTVNDYESTRLPRLLNYEMVLSRRFRETILLNLGYSEKNIAKAVRKNMKIKTDRRKTVNNLGIASKIEEKIEAFRKRASCMSFSQDLLEQKTDTLFGHLI